MSIIHGEPKGRRLVFFLAPDLRFDAEGTATGCVALKTRLALPTPVVVIVEAKTLMRSVGTSSATNVE